MSAVPAVRLMFVNPNPLTLAPGAEFTVIEVSGAPAVIAIGIVNGTFCKTPMYVLPGQVGAAANAASIPARDPPSATADTTMIRKKVSVRARRRDFGADMETPRFITSARVAGTLSGGAN